MYLRQLKSEDADHMIKWMHDENVVKYLNGDFKNKTIEDCERFIENSISDSDIHLAISSDKDEYMGTVSLKNICAGSAEFAITICTKAMGKGYSWFGMQKIIEKAFSELNLDEVYWCVSRNNQRAIRFYDKHGYKKTKDVPKTIKDRYTDANNLIWYCICKQSNHYSKEKVAGCRIVNINTIVASEGLGELSFFESNNDIDFEIKRIYYISKVPEGGKRGFHAHKKLKQLIFCPYGKIKLILENKNGREEIELVNSNTGILIEQCTWREMIWLQSDSVLCVAASDYYEEDDYIRDYNEFKRIIMK